jgi:hypothetical protein
LVETKKKKMFSRTDHSCTENELICCSLINVYYSQIGYDSSGLKIFKILYRLCIRLHRGPCLEYTESGWKTLLSGQWMPKRCPRVLAFPFSFCPIKILALASVPCSTPPLSICWFPAESDLC